MKVTELIQQLILADPSAEVILSRDAEGNSHSPLSSVWAGRYLAESTYSGQVGLATLGEVDRAAGYSEDDVLLDGVSAVILGPTN